MGDILREIFDRKRERLAEAQRHRPLATLLAETPPRTESGVLVRALRNPGINIIAEIKRRSPSKGVIREHFDPVAIAQSYTRSGAAAISCLTEEDFFDGSLEYLRAIRPVTSLPLLRKDFIFDSYQLHEARHAGADAVLLIAAMLEPPLFIDLLDEAHGLGLDVLVEVHDQGEVEMVMRGDVRILGINNRNLRTFVTTLETSLSLAKALPRTTILVSESGIRSRADIDLLRRSGFDAFLIGEEFMRSADEGEALEAMLR